LRITATSEESLHLRCHQPASAALNSYQPTSSQQKWSPFHKRGERNGGALQDFRAYIPPSHDACAAPPSPPLHPPAPTTQQ
jgi:hypothetical protein